MNSSIQTQSAQLPVIAGHEITTDEHGRFNLNAIHRASGGENEKRPSMWTRLNQAQELITEMENQSTDMCLAPLESRRGGKTPGTYAHELLAVSYAGWISPRFQLQVNQVFLDYRMGRLKEVENHKALPNPLSPSHQRDLQKAIASRIYAQVPKDQRPAAFKKLYSHLKDRFGVAKYDQIEESRYTEALGAVQSFELEGEWLAPDPKPEGGLHLTDYQAHNMWVIFSHLMHINRIYDHFHLYEHLTGLGSPAGIQLHDHVKEGSLLARLLVKQAESELQDVRRRLDLPERGLLH